MKLEMPPFQQAKLLVVGDLMLDRYWHGDASRMSPEAPAWFHAWRRVRES